MIHHKPTDYPEPHLPPQHRWLSEKWDQQQRVPADAENQVYDSERKVLMFHADGEQHEIHATNPPLWAGKDLGQWIP